MRVPARPIWPLLALVMAACSIEIHGDGWPDELDASVRATAAEINVHYAVLQTTPDLAQARAEVARHAQAIVRCEDDLRADIGTMRCMSGGQELMMGLMSSLDDRVSTYLTAAEEAPTLGTLRALCREYADDVDELFDRMRDRAVTMECM